jgi:predicted PolB exonuclease-like 3'-5' exonuclease
MIYLDIETTYNKDLLDYFVGNIKAPKTYKDQEKIDAYIADQKENAKSKMCVDIDFNIIKFIGVLKDDGEVKQMSLEEFYVFFNEHIDTYVSYNGKAFDFRVIIREAVKKNIGDLKFFRAMREMCDRYSKTHLDLFTELNSYGEWKSLDVLSKIYLGREKKPIDFNTCSDEELKEHNKEDLLMLKDLYLKFRYSI